MIRFTCPNCNCSDNAEDRQAGSAVNCRFCKGQIMLPVLPVATIEAVTSASRPSRDDSPRDLFGRRISYGERYARNVIAVVALGLVIFGAWKFVEYAKRRAVEDAVQEAVEDWARDIGR